METRANLIKIGVFVLAVILAGFGGAFWLLKGDQKGPRSMIAVGFQGSIGGLLPGAAVSFNGIKVGEVTKVEFDGNDPEHVKALLSVDSSTPIRKDSAVALGFSGLTGYATVQITGGTQSSPRLLDQKDGVPELKTDASSVQDLMQGARKLMSQANDTLTVVQQLVHEGAPSVRAVLKNAETFSDALAKNSDNVAKFMDSVGTAADVLNKVAGKIEKLSDDVDGLVSAVDKDKITRIIANAQTISGDLAKSSGEVAGVVADAKTAISGIGNLSANLNGGIDDVRKIVGAIDPTKVSATLNDITSFSHYLTTKAASVDDIIAHAQSTSANVDHFTADLNKKSSEVSKLIDDASSMMQQLEIASHRVDGILSKVDGAVGSDGGQGLFQAGRSFFTEATGAAASFRELSISLRKATDQGLRDVREFIADTHKTLGDVDRAVNNLDRDPQRLIFGPNQSLSQPAPKN